MGHAAAELSFVILICKCVFWQHKSIRASGSCRKSSRMSLKICGATLFKMVNLGSLVQIREHQAIFVSSLFHVAVPERWIPQWSTLRIPHKIAQSAKYYLKIQKKECVHLLLNLFCRENRFAQSGKLPIHVDIMVKQALGRNLSTENWARWCLWFLFWQHLQSQRTAQGTSWSAPMGA